MWLRMPDTLWRIFYKMEFGRKLYSISEIYSIINKAIISRGDVKKVASTGMLGDKFRERLMLAVTEVNKCDMCSYAHTKAALESGITGEEIKELLNGDLKSAPDNELKAILFAQHYAEKRGNPDKEMWIELQKTYGKELAYGIVGVIRMIMLGNSLGIPLGSFINRFKGNPDSRSVLAYEISVLILTIPMFIVAAITSILLKFMGLILAE